MYLESYLMRASKRDDKIDYYADFKSASLNAFLGGTLNGVHNAKWRESSTQVDIFYFPHPFDASIRGVKTKNPQSID